MNGCQQRFQSLSFENEEANEAAVEPPPGYSAFGNARGRIASNVPSQMTPMDGSNRSPRLNNSNRWSRT